MGLFSDLFSSKPAEEAAAAKKAGYQQGYDALTGLYDQGRGALATDLSQGRDALTTNINAGNAAISSGYGAGRDAVTSAYAPLIASTTAGANAYGDATGVNGAEGIARGGSTFKSLPGYSGGLTTGIDAVDRGAAARGGLGGGNTSADIIKFASDYDANKYGNYVSSLAPYLGLNANAVGNEAGLLNNSYAGEAGAKNANFGALGAGLNANYGALGSGVNASYIGQGGAANSNYTGQGAATADAKLAPYSASQNFWGALMGGANLLGKATGVGGFAPSGSSGAISLGGAGGPMPFF